MKNFTYPRRQFLVLSLFLTIFSVSKVYSQLTAKSLTGSNGVFIGFYEFKPPNYDAAKKYPLIIFMHGVGERGNGTTDLPTVLNNGTPNSIKYGHNMTFTWNGKTESFVVLMPQLSTNYGSWQNFYTDEMLKYAKANLSIDTNRVFLAGLSLGGGGVWSYAGTTLGNAQKLAGIGISCGTYQWVNFCNIANAKLPTWAFHASNDGTVNVNETINSINNINNCNPVVKPYMTIWPDGNHAIWGRVFDTEHNWQNPNIYEWFLGQNKSLPANIRPIANGGPDLSTYTGNGTVTLNACASYDTDGKIVRYVWRKIDGPGGSINNAISENGIATAVQLWTAGTYNFEVKVIDDRADWSLDTVKVVVKEGGNINNPPVANAGNDITLTLPKNSTTLNGLASYDTEGITSYAWSYVSGPSQYTIANSSAPSTSLTNLVQGTYKFMLTVTDNAGQKSTATVNVTVNVSGTNQPPVANAGNDITLTLPANSAILNGAGSYDPDGSIKTYNWSWISGPSQYSLTNAGTSTATISSLVQGTYLFKLTVTDNSGSTASDTVKVTVNPAPNQPPIANAGADVSLTLPVNNTTLNGSASSDPDGTITSYTWTYVSGPTQYSLGDANAAITTLTNLVQGTYVFKLTVKDNSGSTASATINVVVNSAANKLPIAKAGNDISITLPTNSTTLDGSGSYDPDGTITSYLWSWVSGPSQYSIVDNKAKSTTLSNLVKGTYIFKLTVTDNSGASTSDSIQVVVNPAPNRAPVAIPNDDITITLPTNSVQLNGSNSTDFDGTIVSYNWSWVSGPSQYTFTNANAYITAVSNLVQGTYVFQLKVTDNDGASGAATVKVIVNKAPNKAPIANAGNAITITLPTNNATLNGAASSDNDGSIVSYVWTYTSGPSQYSLLNGTSATATLVNLVQGTYVFTLTVTDNDGASSSATVSVTVLPPPNKPPIANAGNDTTVYLPNPTIRLNASASYDPDGKIVSYSWTRISGGGALTIVNSTTATPSIIGVEAGSYIFEVTVTDDKGATGKDQVTVTVLPKPNSKPVAVAGKDTTIAIPASSALLDGRRSYDPDGTISKYAWRQIEGPSISTIANATLALTTVTNLQAGVYSFELLVTDNSGETAKDTFTVTVVNNMRSIDRLLVYPNPVTSITNIRLRCFSDTTGPAKVSIFDMHGKLVFIFSTNKTQSYLDIAIPATGLLSGVYFVEINIDNKKKMVTRFVKQ